MTHLKCMEKHLSSKQKTKYCEHGDTEDCSSGVGIIGVTDGVEEEQEELLDEQRDADTVDSTSMDILVDFGSFVGKV